MTTETFTNYYKDDGFSIDLWGEESYVVRENLASVDAYECSVEWDFTIEMRSWGVKDLSAYATKVSLSLFVEYYDKDENLHDEEVEVDLKDWEINSERDRDNGDMFNVQNVSVDFKEKLIIVEF